MKSYIGLSVLQDREIDTKVRTGLFECSLPVAFFDDQTRGNSNLNSQISIGDEMRWSYEKTIGIRTSKTSFGELGDQFSNGVFIGSTDLIEQTESVILNHDWRLLELHWPIVWLPRDFVASDESTTSKRRKRPKEVYRQSLVSCIARHSASSRPTINNEDRQWRTERETKTYVGDFAKSANGRSSMRIFFVGHVFRQTGSDNDHIADHGGHFFDDEIQKSMKHQLNKSSRWKESLSISSHVFWLKEFCHGEKGFRRFSLTELFSLKRRSIKDDEQHRAESFLTWFNQVDWSCRWSSWGFEYIFSRSSVSHWTSETRTNVRSMFARTWTWRSSLHYFLKHRCLC